MIQFTRSWRFSVCLSLLTLTLAIAIPVIAQPSIPKTPIVATSENALELINHGRTAYDSGRYAEASATWKKAERIYYHQGDRLSRAATLNYLSLACQKLGEWQRAERANSISLKLLEQLNEPHSAALAQALNTQGNLLLATGKPQAALETWQQAATAYEHSGDRIGVIGSQINQAQALQALGFHRRSQKLLERLQERLEAQNDPLLKAKVLQSLGNTLQIIGGLNRSEKVLQASLEIAKQLQLPKLEASILFSLGNTAKLLEHNQAAVDYYQQAIATNVDPLTSLEARSNLLNLYISTQQWQATTSVIAKILDDSYKITASRPIVYVRVNLAKNLIDLQAKNPDSGDRHIAVESLLKQTLEQARKLQDKRAESSTLGTLGYFYEQQQQWSTAQKFTEQALNLSQTINATDISYQWQWQLGRLLRSQGNTQKAIAPYTEAVNNLQALRSSLVAVNPDAQFSFRESVEPVYRELVETLLDANPTQAHLKQARETIESLQLAELENFFQEACLKAKPKQIDEVDATAAVIYPIILRDRLAVILSLPDRSLKYYPTFLPQAEIERTIENLYQSFNPIFSNRQRKELSHQVYDWLIKPAEADLTKHGIKTLAFVLDGSLRNLPMSALYDGKQYAIEKYNIALTPGLQLLTSTGLDSENLEAVIAGVSESNQGFASLPGVKQELTQISAKLSSQLLLDRDFTDANLQAKISQTDAPIVHLATHGQFSSDPENTYIVTWNDRIQVNEFETLLRTRESSRVNPIDLMVLSACQTATGDRQAALGMAGLAVRSGARSTLATLWSVKDESTTVLMDRFYQELVESQTHHNKAEALRQAQLKLIHSPDFNHPFYWSPFVLVGNWL